MSELVQRRLTLKAGKKAEFLELLEVYKAKLKEDDSLRACTILSSKDSDVILFQFILNDDADWESRVKKDYVKSWIHEMKEKDLLEDMAVEHFEMHHFHGQGG